MSCIFKLVPYLFKITSISSVYRHRLSLFPFSHYHNLTSTCQARFIHSSLPSISSMNHTTTTSQTNIQPFIIQPFIIQPFIVHHSSHVISKQHKGYRQKFYNNLDNKTFLLLSALGLVYLCANNDNEENNRKFLLAAKNEDLSLLKKSLRNGVDPNVRHQLGWTALHTAVINNNYKVIEWLIKEGGADVNIQDEFSSARRMAKRYRSSSSQVSVIRNDEFCYFINHNATYSGFTPLHYAVVIDNNSIVNLLLENGADPTQEDSAGRTPINYCSNETMKEQLKHYASIFDEKKRQEKLEERRRYPLEDQLRQHLVGQEGPITTVASAIRRRELGWGDTDHPLVFLFLGSSGIGKTELAKQVAQYLHKGNNKGFIRLDMSEYQEKHEVAKLIGAPPGYIGYDQGGQLTSKLTECPNAVVLFDEVDKAHPDVLTVMLQLFDEGRLTDGQGKTISCKDAIFVMTSNLGSDEIADHALRLRRDTSQAVNESKGDENERIEISRDFKETVIEPILKHHFHRDEFLGRINEMVYFLPFSRSELHQLVSSELDIWKKRAAERHSIQLTWDKEVLDVLADGYNVKYGARSIHHEVERVVVNQLALAYEQSIINKGNHVKLIVKNEEGKGTMIKIQVTNNGQTLSNNNNDNVKSNFVCY